MANPNPNTSGLKQFSSTYQPKNRGRKPSAIKKAIKSNGISAEDIQNCFLYVLGKTREELQDIVRNPKESIILVAAATAMLKDLSKGSLGNISTVIRKANVDPDMGQAGDSSEGSMPGSESEIQFSEYHFPEADELE